MLHGAYAVFQYRGAGCRQAASSIRRGGGSLRELSRITLEIDLAQLVGAVWRVASYDLQSACVVFV